MWRRGRNEPRRALRRFSFGVIGRFLVEGILEKSRSRFEVEDIEFRSGTWDMLKSTWNLQLEMPVRSLHRRSN